MKNVLLPVFLILLGLNSSAQNTEYYWTGHVGGNNSDTYGAITLDQDNNIYLAGRFDNIADLDPTVGVASFNDLGLNDGFVCKMNPDSTFLWAIQLGGAPDGNVFITDLYVDADNNLFIVGQFRNTVDFDPGPGVMNMTSNGDWDSFLCQLDADGNFLWGEQWGDTGTDYSTSITQDILGNFILSGFFTGTHDFDHGVGISELTSSSGDPYILKLDPSLDFIWVKQLEGSGPESVEDIAFNPDNSMVVCGNFSGTMDLDPGVGLESVSSISNYDVFFLKLDSAGNFLWGGIFVGAGGVFATAMDIDSSGDILIGGYFYNDVDFNPGIDEEILVAEDYSGFNTYNGFLSKLNSDGDLQWVHKIGELGYALIFDFALDSDNSIFIGGTYKGIPDMDPGINVHLVDTGNTNEAYISKFTASGTFSYIETFGGIGWDEVRGITLDGNGGIYYAGQFTQIADFDPSEGVDELQADGFFSNDVFISILNVVNSIPGCMDELACNYDPLATVDDSSCTYAPCGPCEGDANLDGQVNVLDLVSISSNFGCNSGCEGNGDANSDGTVNILDFVSVSSHFGSLCD